MNEQTEKLDIDFYKLVLSMQAAAWQQLGKVASPLSGKIERNLEAAKQSIDILEMLHRKTRGNLTEEEQRLIDQALYDLRLNYVEEVKKGEEAPAEGKPKAPTSGETQSEGGKEAGTKSGEAEPEKKAGGDGDQS